MPGVAQKELDKRIIRMFVNIISPIKTFSQTPINNILLIYDKVCCYKFIVLMHKVLS